MDKIHVCVIGSGNWSTALAKVIAENVVQLDDVDNKVNMYVYDEIYKGKRLSEIINRHHVNSKYLPNVPLPENLVAYNDLIESVQYADIIIFIVPSKYIPNFCKTLMGKLKPQATAVSIVKGFIISDSDGIELISHAITRYLKIPCAVLAGVNLPSEIVTNQFCEATIGCADIKLAKILKDLFQNQYFHVVVVEDCDCVEICSLLKNIIAFGVGVLDGLHCNENIKSALIRVGLLEMMQFIDIFYPGCKFSTYFQSCCIADVITVCHGSRNRGIGEAFARTQRKIEHLEVQLLKGQKVLGPLIVRAVNVMLTLKGVENKFPIFTQIHKICEYTAEPSDIINCILEVPDRMFHLTDTLSL